MKKITPLLLSIFALSAPLTKGNEKEPIQVQFTKIGTSRKGELVLGVEIRALSHKLQLGKLPDPNTEQAPTVFSLGESYLVDAYSSEKIQPLPTLPYRPFFGPMEVTTEVPKGGVIRLGIAFPPPPPPPVDSEGKPKEYRFLFYIPSLSSKGFPLTFPSLPVPSPSGKTGH